MSVEAPHETKVGHWETEKAVWMLMKRKSGDLLRCAYPLSFVYGASGFFLRAEKTAAAIQIKDCCSFLFFWEKRSKGIRPTE